jgi:hypothetical protein
MFRTVNTAAKLLRPTLSPNFSRAHLTGLLRDASTGTLSSLSGAVSPVFRFHLVTSLFSISAETAQLPPGLLDPTEASGNVHVVDVVGTAAFVNELAAFFQDEAVVEVSGRLHTELYGNTTSKLFCPTVNITLDRLLNTEDTLRIVHLSHADTRELQARLRRLIFRHDPLRTAKE